MAAVPVPKLQARKVTHQLVADYHQKRVATASAAAVRAVVAIIGALEREPVTVSATDALARKAAVVTVSATHETAEKGAVTALLTVTAVVAVTARSTEASTIVAAEKEEAVTAAGAATGIGSVEKISVISEGGKVVAAIEKLPDLPRRGPLAAEEPVRNVSDKHQLLKNMEQIQMIFGYVKEQLKMAPLRCKVDFLADLIPVSQTMSLPFKAAILLDH